MNREVEQLVSVDRYLSEVSRYELLSVKEEKKLALSYFQDGDLDSFWALANANLRFVVKVSHEYTGYGLPLLDLIQEGNAGLLKAVEKFNPHKGNRLISYAVWWIRAYIQNYVMRCWSLVRIGTTQAQRKLFFKLRSEKEKVQRQNRFIDSPATVTELSSRLGVSETDVIQMDSRLLNRDFSLNSPVGESQRHTHIELLRDENNHPEQVYATVEERRLLRRKINEVMKGFNDKERFIVARRLMADEPMTLKKIGLRFSISRERVRQIEARVLHKLRMALRGTELDRQAA